MSKQDKEQAGVLLGKMEETAWTFLEGVASTLSKGEALDFEKVSKMLADQIVALFPDIEEAVKDWEKQFLIGLLEAGIQVASMADVITVLKATEAYAKKQSA